MRPPVNGGRGRIVVRPMIRPSGETAVMADEWQRQGRPHFISKRAFQARRRFPVKADGDAGFWEELKNWLFGETEKENKYGHA